MDLRQCGDESGAFLEESPEAIAGFNARLSRDSRRSSPIPRPPSTTGRESTADRSERSRSSACEMAIGAEHPDPHVKEKGFGANDEARMARARAARTTALNLLQHPAGADIWTTRSCARRASAIH